MNVEKVAELMTTVQACTDCGLHQGCKGKVFGTPNIYAPIMVIGEAPGENEDITGLPFTGKAGKLLDKMLESIYLNRDSNVFLTNILKCRPPNNRNPERAELDACGKHLEQQIDLMKPKFIISTGGFSTAFLLGKESIKITYVAGKKYEYKGIPFIPIFHPAYLLRNEEAKTVAWEHLKIIYDAIESLDIYKA